MPVPLIKIATFMAKYGQELFLGKPPSHHRRRRDDMQSSRLYTLKRIWVFLSSFSMAGCIYLFAQLMTVSAEYNKLLIEKKKWQDRPVIAQPSDATPSAEAPSAPASAPIPLPSDPIVPPKRTDPLYTPPPRHHEDRRHRELIDRLKGLENH